jgi:hypothetical protein
MRPSDTVKSYELTRATAPGGHLLLERHVPEGEEERDRHAGDRLEQADPRVPSPLPMISACVDPTTSAQAATGSAAGRARAAR